MAWVQTVSALALGLSCGLVCEATQDAPALRVFVYTAVEENTLLRAEVESSRILERAGVGLIWRNCGNDDPCQIAPDSDHVILRIGKEMRSGGLGCSFVRQAGGVVAVIGLGNIQRLASSTRIAESQILAAVMAHEIGHLMLGPAHSGNGLMHGNWDVHDLCQLEQRQLKFDPDQCKRIQAAVLARSRPERPLIAARMP